MQVPPLIVLKCLFFVLSYLCLSDVAYANWPQFQYDAQHTGYNPHANVQPGLELKFQKRLGDQQLKALAICDGLALTVARVGPTLGYDTMYCYDAVSGEDVWIDSVGPWIGGTAQGVAAYDMWYIQVKRDNVRWPTACCGNRKLVQQFRPPTKFSTTSK